MMFTTVGIWLFLYLSHFALMGIIVLRCLAALCGVGTEGWQTDAEELVN